MRAEKTPDGGMKGVLMSVTENDLVPYLVKIDASGKEISREPLPAPAAGRRRWRVARRRRWRCWRGAAACSGRWCSACLLVAGPVRRPPAGDNATARMAAQTAAPAAAP